MFAALVHGPTEHGNPLSQASPVTFVTKDEATVGKKPGVVISFDVVLPDGKVGKVQAVLTVALLNGALSALRGRYGPGGPKAHLYGNDNPFIF